MEQNSKSMKNIFSNRYDETSQASGGFWRMMLAGQRLQAHMVSQLVSLAYAKRLTRECKHQQVNFTSYRPDCPL